MFTKNFMGGREQFSWEIINPAKCLRKIVPRKIAPHPLKKKKKKKKKIDSRKYYLLGKM